MKAGAFFKQLGLILFFGLCITLLSGRAAAFAGENDAKLNVTDMSIPKGSTDNLKVFNVKESQSVIYRSGNPEVASVSEDSGDVTGLSYGSTVVTATVVEDGKAVVTLQCNIVVGPAAVSIKLTKTSLVLMAGKQKLLNTVILPLNTVEKPRFFSPNTEIAKVSPLGRVRAVQPGSVRILAILANKQYAVCDVTVLDEESYAKYLDGMTIEEILAENEDGIDADEPEEDGSEDETDENEKVSSGSGEKVTDDSTEKKAAPDGSEDQAVQDAPIAVEEK